MKLTRLIIVAGLTLSLSFLGGCSYFKSQKEGAVDEGAQTAGMGDQDGFGPEGVSAANRLKAPYNQAYYFDYDKYEVKQDDVESINVQAGYLIAHPNARVRLEGNTDERGSREYNVALGWKRAKAVNEVLKQQGVNDKQIVVISYGKEKPLALGHDESSYVRNRRVDLIYEIK